jgi:UDP-N-acetylglucosamine 2-epimerase (non-hydrolysing)
MKENIKEEQIFVVGNTIVEVARDMANNIFEIEKSNSHILLDIHRPENFKDKNRLQNIITFANAMFYIHDLPVVMLNFGRTEEKIKEWNLPLENITLIPLMSYKNYINTIIHSSFLISDSGTAQEEPALFNTPVIVPRDFTERIESIENGCSFMIDVNSPYNKTWTESHNYLDGIKNNIIKIDTDWLGDGNTSEIIVSKIKQLYN